MYREYFEVISSDHQRKLLHIMNQRGIDSESALRNIVMYIEAQNASMKGYFAGLVTAQQIESTIDMLRV